MRAYEYLNQLKRLDEEIERSIEKEVELWSAVTNATQALNGMPHAPGVCDKVGNAVSKMAAQREKTNALIDRYADAKRDVLLHLSALTPKQREVLCWMFVYRRENRERGQDLYYTWAEVAKALECSEQNIAKIRVRAIKNLQKILDSEKKVLS